jgi:hypothetical protein
MDVLKSLLAARPEKTPEVKLLSTLAQPTYMLWTPRRTPPRHPPPLAPTQQVQAVLDALAGFQGLQLAICSVGGVGSTELSNFLTRHAGVACNLLTDQDTIRHVNS